MTDGLKAIFPVLALSPSVLPSLAIDVYSPIYFPFRCFIVYFKPEASMHIFITSLINFLQYGVSRTMVNCSEEAELKNSTISNFFMFLNSWSRRWEFMVHSPDWQFCRQTSTVLSLHLLIYHSNDNMHGFTFILVFEHVKSRGRSDNSVFNFVVPACSIYPVALYSYPKIMETLYLFNADSLPRHNRKYFVAALSTAFSLRLLIAGSIPKPTLRMALRKPIFAWL